MKKRFKFHKINIELFLFFAILMGLSISVFPQKDIKPSPAFPFSIEIKDVGLCNNLYVYLDIKYFNRKNLQDLFAHLSMTSPNNNLCVKVFSDKEILLKQAKWDKLKINHFERNSVNPARKAFFDEYLPPETGYFRAFYYRINSSEYFRYSPEKESVRMITVTLKSYKNFVNSQDFLFDSVKTGNEDAVEWLVKQNPKQDLENKDSNDITPLMWAVWLEHNKIANVLISAGAKVNYFTSNGSPLISAVSAQNVEGVKLLIKKGADLNASGKFGKTPLMLSLLNCNYEITKLLLKNGAHFDSKDESDKTAEMLSCDDKRIIKLLNSTDLK